MEPGFNESKNVKFIVRDEFLKKSRFVNGISYRRSRVNVKMNEAE